MYNMTCNSVEYVEPKKMCPMKFLKKQIMFEGFECEKEKCAWWCEWTKSCAMVAIPAEISDRAHDIMTTIGE